MSRGKLGSWAALVLALVMGLAPVVSSFHQHPIADWPGTQAMGVERHGRAAATGPCLVCRATHQHAQLPFEPAGPARGVEPSADLLRDQAPPPLDPHRHAVSARAPPAMNLTPAA